MAQISFCLTQLFYWKEKKERLECRNCYQKWRCKKYIRLLIEEDEKAR